MKVLLKNLGLLIILAGAILLLVSAYTGNVNDNGILVTSAVLVVVGLIVYIILNKRITD